MKHWKRSLSLLLAGAMVLSLAACGKKGDEEVKGSAAPGGNDPASAVTYRMLYASEVETMNYLTTTTFEKIGRAHV